MRRALTPKQRLWVIGTLLIALVVRALIPAGFMPATDRPLSFQVCPDGFPASLLSDAGKALPPGGDSAGQAATAGTFGQALHQSAAGVHAGHHHDAFAQADSGIGMAHASHHHPTDGMPAVEHHHDAPGHNHSSASAEHCVFAAAAGAFALAFLATLSAPAPSISAPDVAYVAPSFESHRFRLPQPRGPPALS